MQSEISNSRFGTVVLSFAIALVSVQLARPAAAQTNPKFEFAKPEEVKAVEWKAQAKGGVLVTTGTTEETGTTPEGLRTFVGRAGDPFYLDGTVVTAVVTAIKTNQGASGTWSFDVTDRAGNVRHCA